MGLMASAFSVGEKARLMSLFTGFRIRPKQQGKRLLQIPLEQPFYSSYAI